MGLFDLFKAKKPDLDHMVLDQLKKAGSNLSKPHNIDFFLYFSTQESAAEAAVTLKAEGFQVRVQPAAQGPNWLCQANKTMVPELSVLQKIRQDFNALAASKRGVYDGWGTETVS